MPVPTQRHTSSRKNRRRSHHPLRGVEETFKSNRIHTLAKFDKWTTEKLLNPTKPYKKVEAKTEDKKDSKSVTKKETVTTKKETVKKSK
jgi:hypothetical protein